MATYIRFECGNEDRMSMDYGPFDWIQVTYDRMLVCHSGSLAEVEFAHMTTTNHWQTGDTQLWSDFVIFATEEKAL